MTFPTDPVICIRKEQTVLSSPRTRSKRAVLCTAILALQFSTFPSQAQDAEPEAKEPQLLSLFPGGARTGTSVEVEVRGQVLWGTRAAFFETEGLKGEVKRIEEIEVEVIKKPSQEKIQARGQKVFLKIDVSTDVPSGLYPLRLIAARGLSNSLPFRVHTEPVVLESGATAPQSDRSQPVTWPVVVMGKLSQEGERDYYAVEGRKHEKVVCELYLAPDEVDPHLALYRPSGSWFDPGRLIPVAFKEEPIFKLPYLIHEFDEDGRYIVEVGSLIGLGGEDYSYQLKIVPAPASASSEWEKWLRERIPPKRKVRSLGAETDRYWEFFRKLEPDRLPTLWSRGAGQESTSGSSESSSGAVGGAGSAAGAGEKTGDSPPAPLGNPAPEKEPNDAEGQALHVGIPVIIEGRISHPGDIDYFSFDVAGGEALALEIETPEVPPARFNPFLSVVEPGGKELFNNVYKHIGGDGDDWIRTIEPKTLYTFSEEGRYYLCVKDLTVRYGGPHFFYRILVRPQIPHVGEFVEVQGDRINILPGEHRKLTVITEHQEGFSGQVSIALEDLPKGVRAISGTDISPFRPAPPLAAVHMERFRPHYQRATIMLVASPDAPLTPLPQQVSLSLWPVLDARPGPRLPVQNLPLMVVKPALADGEVKKP